MSTGTLPLILIAAAVVVIAALAILIMVRRVRSRNLHQKFGDEYDYIVEHEGDQRKAEQTLMEREKRVDKLDIHELDENARDRYNEEWMEIQASFVDDPKHAVEHANRLITEVMIARGFPVTDFEQRAADLSVLYPKFVPNYRAAYAISQKNRNEGSSTEELRQAMVHYRSLVGELIGTVETKEKTLEAV